MNRAMVLNRFGGPEVLEMCAVPEVAPGPGEIRIRHAAIGVNFTDVHGRRGDYRDLHDLPKPLVLGMEAVGVVEAAGPGAERFRTGDRVAYATRPLGAYCEARNFPAARCVPVPAGLADEVVAATFLKGLTVHVLVRRVFRVEPRAWVVFHSAAGGVGALAGQWLRALGARAIGIVGSAAKVASALESGYEAVFVDGRDDWPARVRELTSGAGVAVVYDPVGLATWEGSIACLGSRGRLVCFGNSSGLVPPLSVNLLRDRGSLWITWVRFGDYTATPDELEAAARDLFDALGGGLLRPRPPRTLPLAQAAEAHRLLESRETTGALVLIP
ncbi:MAG: quinone oxidoreductase [Proteobacteria bacterium]|nr:quinone oxidoreductase [Pseudomonadota bacterium]